MNLRDYRRLVISLAGPYQVTISHHIDSRTFMTWFSYDAFTDVTFVVPDTEEVEVIEQFCQKAVRELNQVRVEVEDELRREHLVAEIDRVLDSYTVEDEIHQRTESCWPKLLDDGIV